MSDLWVQPNICLRLGYRLLVGWGQWAKARCAIRSNRMRARLSVHGVFAHMGEASLGWLSPNTSNALLCGSRGHARPQQGSPLMV